MADKFFSFDNSDNQLKNRESQSPRWQEYRYVVKFLHRGLGRGNSPAGLLRQFPGAYPQWQNCYFQFDVDCREYDWLVVYQDLPESDNLVVEEKLCCPKEKTILITGEPSSITVFGTDYIRQFGMVLTFQEPWAMRHPEVIFHHPGLIWYYGLPFGDGEFLTWDQMATASPPKKSKSISTVCSQRKGSTTLHSSRVEFTAKLKQDLPELDIFGHGVLPMNDKAEALDPYMHHIVIENHIYNHHITEKLPDAFLGCTLPFYHGAPNTAFYFPEDSFITIDIEDYRRAREIIQFHLANNEYLDRLPAILEARRRVVEEQNLFAILNRIISEKDPRISTATLGKCIRNRSTMRLKNPLAGIRSLTEKTATKAYHRMVSTTRKLKKRMQRP